MGTDELAIKNAWNSVLWFLKYVCAPFAVPFVILRLIRKFTPKESLQGKVVVITGASSGIGEALAHKFYNEGCKIVLASRRLTELQRVKNDLLSTRVSVPTNVPEILQIDLADLNNFSDHVSKILEMYGRIDILINNAGVSYRGTAKETDLNVDVKIMSINYFGQIGLTKAILPQMLKQKSGHIVFVNSLQGKVGLPRRSAYAASKHALLGFADSLRAEVHKDNIHVTTVCPSYVKTELSLNAFTSSGEKYGKMDTTTSKGASPESIADEIFDAIIYKKNEITLGPFYGRLFVYTRNILSPVYFKIMEKFEKDANK